MWIAALYDGLYLETIADKSMDFSICGYDNGTLYIMKHLSQKMADVFLFWQLAGPYLYSLVKVKLTG